MFLNKLDNKSKKIFLYLAHHMARCDKSFSDVQKNLIDSYIKEMNIENINYEENKFSLIECLEKITNKEAQKIILIELLAIVYTDNIMDKAEKNIIDVMVDMWKINPSLVLVYGEWSRSLLSIYIQGEALLELN